MRPGSLISLFALLIFSASVGATGYGGGGGTGNEVGHGGPGKDDDKGPGYGNDDKGGKGGEDDDKGPGKGGKDDDKSPGKGGKDDDKGHGKGGKEDDEGPGKDGKDDDKGHGGGKGQDHTHGDDKPGKGSGHGYGHDHHDDDKHGPGGGHGNGGGNGNGNGGGNGGGHDGGNGGGNGNQCKTYKTCPSGYGKRDLKAHCAHGLTACGVYGGSAGAWECVDIKRDLESCGGCMISLHPTLPATDGVDCTAIAGVADVACVQGQCFVRRCMPGYVVSPEGDDCLYFGDADPGVLAAHYGLD